MIAASSGAHGNLAFMSRRTTVAEPLLKRSRDLASRLRDYKTLAAAENDLGNLYAATGRPVEAASAYSEAIRLAPSFAQALTDRGVVHYLSGHVDQAVVDYDASLQIRPLDAPTYFNRGSAYRQRGQIERAIADYRKAMELDPNFVPARAKLQELGVDKL